MPLDCTKPRFQPRQCNISVGQPQHEVRRFRYVSNFCTKSSLEHLIVRAEAVYNFQPPVLLPPRPWWKLWSKEEREPEMPAIVADLRNAA